MAITRVGTFAQAAGVPATSVTLESSGMAVGNLVVLTSATSSASRGAVQVSGGRCTGLDGGQNWTQVGESYTSDGGPSGDGATTVLTMWVGRVASTSGSLTVTVAYATGTVGACQIDAEIFQSSVAGDVWTINAVDSVVDEGDEMRYPTLAPSSGSALYVGYAVTNNGGTAGNTDGFEYTVDGNFQCVRCYNLNVTGSVSPTCTQGTDDQFITIGALFKAGPAASAPTVNAGLDAEIELGDTFNRTATENANGAPITSRSWTIATGPTGGGVGSTISTAAAVSWTPTLAGIYNLRYSATNSVGTGTDTVQVAVAEPPAPPVRMYLTNSPAAVTPTVSLSGWDDSSSAVVRMLGAEPAGSEASVSDSETTPSTDWDVLLGGWLSPPLESGGTLPVDSPITFTQAYSTSDADADLQPRYQLAFTSNDGTVLRGSAMNKLSVDVEYQVTPTALSMIAVTTTTAVAYQAGDRVLLRTGYRGANDDATPYTGTAYYGGTGTPDLVAGDTDTSRPSWVELPGSLVFEEESPAVEGDLDATLPALSANLSGTVRANATLGGTLPVATAALTGTVRADGALAGTLPAPTADLDADTFVAGTLDATLPLPTAALTGTTASTGVLGAQLPIPAATLAGDVSVAGALSATLQAPAADLDGTVTAAGALEASLPLPTAAIDGTTNTGTLAGTLPEPFANLSGGVLDTGALDATLPLPAAALGGDGAARGELEAVLPMPTADLQAATANPGDLDASLPIPTAALAGTVSMTGVLDAQLPLLTAALGGDGSNTGSLGASLPLPSADLAGGITVVAVIHGTLPSVTASVTAGVTASVTLEAALPMPTAVLSGTTVEQESTLDATLPMPVAALVGAASTSGVLAGVLPLPTASLSARPPVVYEPPLRAGQPVWENPRLRAGTPEHADGLIAGTPALTRD